MSMEQQIAEILTLLKQNQPTERQKLEQQLEDARKRKDFSAVVALSNQLNTLGDVE